MPKTSGLKLERGASSQMEALIQLITIGSNRMAVTHHEALNARGDLALRPLDENDRIPVFGERTSFHEALYLSTSASG